MSESAVQPRPPFIGRGGEAASRVAAALMPSPFVLAVALTLLTLGLSLSFGRSVEALGFVDRLGVVVVEGWAEGLFGAGGLTFAFQMVLVLVTGHALALSPPVRKLIDAVAAAPRSSAQASAVVALTACVAGYIHWGLGAVAGAILARELGRSWHERGKPLHYPLLGAAAYSGLLVWHGGLSGSAPLKVAEKDHFLVDTIGVISADATLFSWQNLVITATLAAVTVALYYLMTPASPPPGAGFTDPDPSGVEADDAGPTASSGSAFVRLLDSSPLIPVLMALLAGGYLVYIFWARRFGALNLNTVNLFFFAAGLALHGSPRSYLKAAGEGARGAAGIVLQFPLYFGILGMLKSSGLIVQLSEFFVWMSTERTLPVFTFLSAGLVNLVVPSGGGQWAVQGPVMMSAAGTLGVAPERVVMALAYGDAWTNMLQPFWALPLLGIMRLRARDIIGYTTVVFVVTGPLIILALLLLPD